MTKTQSLAGQVNALLKNEGFEAETILNDDATDTSEIMTTFKMAISGKNGEWDCTIRVFEHSQRIVAYSIFPRSIELVDIPKASLLIAQINYGLLFGNFELDIGDGEIRYKTSLDSEVSNLSGKSLMNLLFANFFSVDMYFPALMAFINKDVDPQSIINDIESSPTTNQFELLDAKVH